MGIDLDAFIRAAAPMDNAAIRLEIERPDDVIARDKPGATFSAEMVDDIAAAMKAWIGTRLMRPYQHGRPGATKMRVTLSVELDGQTAVLEVPVRLAVIDGQLRLDARNNQ